MNLKNAELKSRKDAATPRGVGVMCDFYAERAQNAELWDVEGRRFIDFAAGIAVCNTGHRHPKIVAAIRDQLDRFTHTAYQIVPYASYVELAEKLNERAPGDHPKRPRFSPPARKLLKTRSRLHAPRRAVRASSPSPAAFTAAR